MPRLHRLLSTADDNSHDDVHFTVSGGSANFGANTTATCDGAAGGCFQPM